MAKPAIIPDRVIPISLGVRGDRAETDVQLRDALAALQREGYLAGPVSDDAILEMAKEVEIRRELDLDTDQQYNTFGHGASDGE